MGGGGSKDQEKVGAIWSEKLGTLQPLKVSPHDWKVALSNSKFERTVKMPDGVYQTEHFEPVKSLLRPERERDITVTLKHLIMMGILDM